MMWACLGTGWLLWGGGPECLFLPRAVWGWLVWRSSPRQGCGSHANTLGDKFFFVLFHTLVLLSFFPLSLSGSTCTVAGDGEGRAPTGSRGGEFICGLGKKKKEKYSRSNFSSELNNIPSPPSHFSSTPAILININKWIRVNALN